MRSLSRKQVRVTPLRVRVSRLPLKHSPVVQRQRLLAYTQATAVQVRPGLLALIRQLAERLGSGTAAVDVVAECLQVRLLCLGHRRHMAR
jgi:hypothetical protein